MSMNHPNQVLTIQDRLVLWIRRTGRTQTALARECNTYPERISEFLKGRRRLARELAKTISDLSGGELPFADLVLAAPEVKQAKQSTKREAA